MTIQCAVCGKEFQRDSWYMKQRKHPERACCSKKCRMETIRVKFWDHVDKSGDCWIWNGIRSHNGYGRIICYGRRRPAHQLAWEFVHGPIPPGKIICHKCDNPACVRESHLFIGTTADNVADKIAKGRMKVGENHGAAKLSSEQVLEIRRLYSTGKYTHKDLGEMFSVYYGNIQKILSGNLWKHLL